MNQFNFNELLNKDKSELDKIKTAIDIFQAEKKYAFEMKKFRTENLRFFLIALMTAIISLGSSYFLETFKQTNINKENIKKEFIDLKKEYLTEKDKNKQGELACALADFDNSIKDKIIERAQMNFKSICTSFSNIQQQTQVISNIDTSSGKVKDALTKLDNYDKELQVLNQQKSSVHSEDQDRINQRIKVVNNDINEIKNTVPEISLAIQSTENIEKNVKQIENANNRIMSVNEIKSKSPALWFKEGYFLHFGDYRVLLQYLDKNLGIQVEVCKTKQSGICSNPLLTRAWIKYNNPLLFSDNGKSYRINLENIDHAGKNPFKLAAYITFEKLN